jgi:predicted F0F1-ATPase subunit
VSTNGETDKPDTPEAMPGALSSKAARFWRQVANMTSIGWSTTLPIAGGVLLGHYLDQRAGEGYVWTVGLLVGGIMVAFYNLYHILTRDLNE